MHGEFYAAFTWHETAKKNTKKKKNSSDSGNKENYLGNTAVIPAYILPSNRDIGLFLGTHICPSPSGKFIANPIQLVYEILKFLLTQYP